MDLETLPENDGADRHRHRGLAGIDHRHAEFLFKRQAVARHAGASHDDDVGAVLVSQFPPDLDHPRKRAGPRSGFGDAHVKWTLACKAVQQAHLPEVADVTAHGRLLDRKDAEPVALGQGGQHRALVDTEDGPFRRLAADLQARVRITGNHEGVAFVIGYDQCA